MDVKRMVWFFGFAGDESHVEAPSGFGCVDHTRTRVLRSALHESECGGGHRDRHVRCDQVPGVEILELKYERRSDLLTFGNQQHSFVSADFLLNNHTGRKQFDSALSYFAFFGVRIQFHQGVEEFRTEVLVLESQRVCRFVRETPLWISFS